MGAMRNKIVGASLMVVAAACSTAPGDSGDPGDPMRSDVGVPSSIEGLPPAADGNALAYFDGTVDSVHGTMNVVYRNRAGDVLAQSTLPYGKAPGDVYFHTCTSGYNSGTHV